MITNTNKRSYTSLINDLMIDIVNITDEITLNDLYKLLNKLNEEGFTQDTIYEEFVDLKRRLLNAK